MIFVKIKPDKFYACRVLLSNMMSELSFELAFCYVDKSYDCGGEEKVHTKLHEEVAAHKAEEHISYDAHTLRESPSGNRIHKEDRASEKKYACINYGTNHCR